MNQGQSNQDQSVFEDLDLLINQLTYQENDLYYPSTDQTVGLPTTHPLYTPASHQASSQLKATSNQTQWRPPSASPLCHHEAPTYPTMPSSVIGDAHENPSRWHRSTFKTALPLRPKPLQSQLSTQDLEQNAPRSVKIVPKEVKSRRGRQTKTVSQLPISTTRNVGSSSTTSITKSIAGEDSSLMKIADFCIQNIKLPHFPLDSLIISNLVLDTFDKVVMPSYAGASTLELQIKAHVTRHILTQNLPRLLDPLVPIMNLLNTSDLINIVIYALQLSGVSI